MITQRLRTAGNGRTVGSMFDTFFCMMQLSYMHVDSDEIWYIKTSSVQLSQYYHT
jgi:hypothetical protein